MFADYRVLIPLEFSFCLRAEFFEKDSVLWLKVEEIVSFRGTRISLGSGALWLAGEERAGKLRKRSSARPIKGHAQFHSPYSAASSGIRDSHA